VISDTLAALTLSGAGFIGTVTLDFIDLNLAFHYEPPLQLGYLLGRLKGRSPFKTHNFPLSLEGEGDKGGEDDK